MVMKTYFHQTAKNGLKRNNMEYITKSAVIAEIKAYKDSLCDRNGNLENVESNSAVYDTLSDLEKSIDDLEVVDPYAESIQYDSIKTGIRAHAETYSFNIKSKLFNQLTKEQQELWRKEIEQACISGGEMGVELARDPRYRENHTEKGAKSDNSSTPMKTLGLHKRTNYKR